MLPRDSEGYTSASCALIGSKNLRELFPSDKLLELHNTTQLPLSSHPASGQSIPIHGKTDWLLPTLTNDTSMNRYFTETLKIPKADPKQIITKLTQSFLEAQSDHWVQDLYKFLLTQKSWISFWSGTNWVYGNDFCGIPIVRLADSSHVPAPRSADLKPDSRPPVLYLPGEQETEFPTVRRSVCEDEKAIEFLRAIGIKEWDKVDDIIMNILPRYQKNGSRISDESYSASQYQHDIERIVLVYHQSTHEQQQRLLGELCDTRFVQAIDAADPEHRRMGVS